MFGIFDSPKEKAQKKFLKALKAQDFDAAKEWIAKGADVNKGWPEGGDDPLVLQMLRHVARNAMNDPAYLDAVCFLIGQGARVSSVDGDGNGPLHYLLFPGARGVQNSDLTFRNTLNALLDAGLALDSPVNNQGQMPLHIAASSGAVAQVLGNHAGRVIKGKAADIRNVINRPDRLGCTPLHIAASCNDLKSIAALLGHGADPTLKDDSGKTALDLANDLDCARAFLQSGHASEKLSTDLSRWVEAAVMADDVVFLDMLKDKGLHPSGIRECREMDLPGQALGEDNFRALGWLLKNGFDAAGLGRKLQRPVEDAVIGDRVKYLDRLKESGIALAEMPESRYWGLINLAVDNVSNKTLGWLLKNGFDPNTPGSDGEYPLHQAIREEDDDVLTLLLAHKARVDVCDDQGWTPIAKAVWSGNVVAVRKLLEAGSDIHQVDGDGDTLLHILIRTDDCTIADGREIARLLLEAGSDPKARNNDGETVRDMAESYDDDETLRVLKSFNRAREKKEAERAKATGQLDGDTITFVRKLPEKRALVESFNFATRERTTVMENHALKVISAPARESFDVIRDKAVLEKAHEAYAAAGGKIPREAVFAPPRRMEPLPSFKK